MPCTGPSDNRAKEEAKKAASFLYPLLTKAVANERTSFSHIRHAELTAKKLDIDSYDFQRYKYSIVGYLIAKLPDEEYHRASESGLRINPSNLNFSQEDLEKNLAELFFIFDCEDF